VADDGQEPSELRRIVRALPRKRVALVLLVLLVNLSLVVVARGIQIGNRGPTRSLDTEKPSPIRFHYMGPTST